MFNRGLIENHLLDVLCVSWTLKRFNNTGLIRNKNRITELKMSNSSYENPKLSYKSIFKKSHK